MKHLKIELLEWRRDDICEPHPLEPNRAWWNEDDWRDEGCRPYGGGANHRPEHEAFQEYLEESES